MAAKDVVITLNVHAEDLTNEACPKQDYVNSKCELHDNNHGSTPNKPENFESSVYMDKKIKWNGNSYDEGFEVAITGIEYESGVQMFDNSPPFRGNGKNNSTIEQKLKKNKGIEGRIETYSINFSVSNAIQTWGPYRIDPKLKMNGAGS